MKSTPSLFFCTKKALLLCLISFLTFPLQAQPPEAYNTLVNQADSLYEAGEYQASGEHFAQAFAAWGSGFLTDRYNAACSWSLAGNADSAFVQLFKLARKANYKNYLDLTDDSDLKPIHSDERWTELCEIVKKNKEDAEKDLIKPLVEMLDSVYVDDQRGRRELSGIAEEYGWDSPEMKVKWAEIHLLDSINLQKVTQILDEYGWLGTDKVGGRGNMAIFLVIQHADLEYQVKYLPMMREAVKAGNARGSSLALLEDRVALRQGKRQIYGSQIGRDPETNEHFVLPLDDPIHVDERRTEVGLPPLADYVKRWEIDWDPEAYLKILPDLEAKQKERNKE
jgi:hypothetical protein